MRAQVEQVSYGLLAAVCLSGCHEGQKMMNQKSDVRCWRPLKRTWSPSPVSKLWLFRFGLSVLSF